MSRGWARKARNTWSPRKCWPSAPTSGRSRSLPFEKGVGVFEVHQILLPRNGVYILENMNTAPLVADKAWEFIFVLGHARITGAVQAIINPVAIR